MNRFVLLAIVLLGFNSAAYSNPTAFGLEIGKTSSAELNEKYDATSAGINKYTRGPMFSVPASEISFSGLRELTAIFNRDDELVGVLTTFPKSKFDYLNKAIGGKYSLVSQEIPFVGTKSATYRDGQTEIKLHAPHLSFEMQLTYLHAELRSQFEQQSEAEKKEREKAESSQL